MPKNFFQDMVRVKRENRAREQLQQTPKVEVPKELPKEVLPVEPKVSKEVSSSVETRFASVYDVVEGGDSIDTRPRKGRGIWYVAGVSIIFLLLAFSVVFSGAYISINPKTMELPITGDFLASTDGKLYFDVIALSGEETRELVGGAEEEVKESARGTVILYNNFSSASQNLDINTRLEGSNGKIYKTETKTTVPGMKGSTPGSVEVRVYGSEPGEEYNSGPLDFTIFGFKGTPKYSKFYARSKGDLTGGFTGVRKTVSETDKDTALTELRESLKTKLFTQAMGQIPEGYILFPDSAFLEVESESLGEALPSGMVPVVAQGTLYGFLFEENNLTKNLAEKIITDYDGSEVFIPNVRDLVFSLKNAQNISFKDAKSITFGLSGTAKVVWRVPEEDVGIALLGVRKKDFNSTMAEFQNTVGSADLSLRPFWKRSLPDKKEDLKITVNYPK